IDVTEAMTVIDVNSGKFIGKESMEETALELNLHAIDEIARQIKLRNISGIIIIDFIDVKSKDNTSLIISKAKSAFKYDKAKTNIIGMTKLNLMEITRKKNKDNFFNLITEECEHCNGSGRIVSQIYIFMKIEGIIKKIKKNTSSEAVVLNAGYVLYNKLTGNLMGVINQIEKKYNMNIFFVLDEKILTDEIVIERMGKADYIKTYLSMKK
ncbi:MAG: ribonuclease E/G, partial [Sedimentibacter sp.]